MNQRKAFTLVELLVVITIVALLVAMLLPSLHNARKHVREVICLASHRQLLIGYSMYLDDNKQYLYSYDFSVVGDYYWPLTPLESYYSSGATNFFDVGCPGRDRAAEKPFGYSGSFGVNGNLHSFYPAGPPASYASYMPHHAVRFDEIRHTQLTHMFSDQFANFRRYFSPVFYPYVIPRGNRHESEGLGVIYADGHAQFEPMDPVSGYGIWTADWHYITSCTNNGCFWHPFKYASSLDP